MSWNHQKDAWKERTNATLCSFVENYSEALKSLAGPSVEGAGDDEEAESSIQGESGPFVGMKRDLDATVRAENMVSQELQHLEFTNL